MLEIHGVENPRLLERERETERGAQSFTFNLSQLLIECWKIHTPFMPSPSPHLLPPFSIIIASHPKINNLLKKKSIIIKWEYSEFFYL